MGDAQPNFKAFVDFELDDLDSEALVSQRMLRRLADIDDPDTPGPGSVEARAALSSSVVAHAVVELEAQLIALKRQL